jgi:hypothetical protein
MYKCRAYTLWGFMLWLVLVKLLKCSGKSMGYLMGKACNHIKVKCILLLRETGRLLANG